MLSAIEEILRFHPASQFGHWECRQSDLAAFEELERRPVRRRHEYEYEAERSEPTFMIGEVVAAAAMFVVFCGVLTVIAHLAGDSPVTAQPPAVTASDAAEPS